MAELEASASFSATAAVALSTGVRLAASATVSATGATTLVVSKIARLALRQWTSNGNNSSTTVDIPSGTTRVVLWVMGIYGPGANWLSGGSISIGGNACTLVAEYDEYASNSTYGGVFTLANPPTGSSVSVAWDWAGTGNSWTTVHFILACYAGVASVGAYGGENVEFGGDGAGTTGALATASDDWLVAAGHYWDNEDTSGTGTWTGATLVADYYTAQIVAEYAENIDPSNPQTVGFDWNSVSPNEDGSVIGVVLQPGSGVAAELEAACSVAATAAVALSTRVALVSAASVSGTASAAFTTRVRLVAAATASISATAATDLTVATGLAASATVTASASATLSLPARLAASASVTGSGAATLSTRVALAAAASGTTTATTALTTRVRLVAAPAVTSTAATTVTTRVALAASATGTATTTTALTTRVRLVSTATGTATATTTLTAGGGLAASATVTATATTTLICPARLAASATVTATGTAGLVTQVRLVAAAPVTATAAAVVTTPRPLAAAATVTSTASATLSTRVALASAAPVMATAVCALTTRVSLRAQAPVTADASLTLLIVGGDLKAVRVGRVTLGPPVGRVVVQRLSMGPVSTLE